MQYTFKEKVAVVTGGANGIGRCIAEEFRKRNGSLICAELLGLAKSAPTPATPEARTAEYYKKRPCVKMVEEAARIFGEYLEKK